MVPVASTANTNPMQQNHVRTLVPSGNTLNNTQGHQPVVSYNRSYVPSTNPYNNNAGGQQLTPIEYMSNPVAVRPHGGMSSSKGGMFQPTFPNFDGLKHQVCDFIFLLSN